LNVWLETDSRLVYLAFRSSSIVPSSLKNRWNICVGLPENMNVSISHIYKKENSCADALANMGFSVLPAPL